MKKVANILFVLLCSASLSSRAQSIVIDSTQEQINLYSTKLKWHPSEQQFLLERGKLFIQTEKFDSAVTDLSLCYQKDSFNTEIKKLLATAICKRNSANVSDSFDLVALHTSLTLDSTCSCAKISMGTFFLLSHQMDSAVFFLKNNLNDKYADKMLVTDMIGMWYFIDSNYTEALQYLKDSSLEIESMKALSHYYLGNYQEAIANFEKIDRDKITESKVIFIRAKCYQQTGQLDKAIVDFEKLQQNGYTEQHTIAELRITKIAWFISRNWYYVLGMLVTLMALLLVLYRILKGK